MRTLVLLVHADPSVADEYAAACGPGVDVRCYVRPGLSSVYAALAVEMRARSGGGVAGANALAGLAAAVGVRMADYDRVILATYSAGYAFARALTAAEWMTLEGYVSIDSAHAGLDKDGTAADTGPVGVEWLARLARRAATENFVLALGHSDVDPVTYASTTKVAREVERLSSVDCPRFLTLGFDLFPPSEAKREHGAALTSWGPSFVARALRCLDVQDRGGDPLPASGMVDAEPFDASGLRLGLRALAWLGVEGVSEAGGPPREVPGDRHLQRILDYSRECRRGGRFQGVELSNSRGRVALWDGGSPLALSRDEDAWCAAIQSAALLGSLRPGEAPPHGLRVSVREHVEDARREGTLRPLEYTPRPGDVGIDARAGGDPLKGGTGHEWRVVALDPTGARVFGVGGNEGNALSWSWRPIRSPERRAWIAV